MQSDQPCPNACQLLRIPGFDWSSGVQYDAMHVLSGIVKDVVLGTLTQSRITDAVRENEANLRRPLPVKPGKAADIRLAFEAALALIPEQISTSTGEYRFARLLDPSKKVKAQTCLAICSPFGLYALKCVQQHLQPTAYLALNSVLQILGMIWMKEVPIETLPMLEALVNECICNVESYLPEVERDIKLHELQHLVESIREWGGWRCDTLHAMWTWFLLVIRL